MELELTESTLYERMGGKEKLQEVLHYFHGLLLEDERVKGFFASLDMGKHLEQQMNFIIRIAGGSCGCSCQCGKGSSTGSVMKKAHEKLQINSMQFDIFMDHLVSSFRNCHVNEREIQELVALLQPMKQEIVQSNETP